MGRELIVLGLAFLLAGLLARIGRRIGLPTIPLFVGAGILAGPNTPGPVLFAHPEDLELLAAFGLIFLLFYLGVEFSLEDLTSGGRTLLTSAALYLTLNIGAGLLLGFAIGWGTKEAFIIAGATGISSSAIVTKLLVELRRLRNPETSLILGIIVLEDLFLALYLAALAPVLGTAANTGEAVLLFVRALAFLIALGLLARYGRAVVGRVISAPDDKLLVVLFVGFALLVAGIAYQLGVSDAIGAFMAGLVLSGTIAKQRIERLVLPLRDAFGALFFFHFGLVIDPGEIGKVAVPALAAVCMSLLLAIVAAIGAARLNRLNREAAANIAFSVVARGEFALILAVLATDAGLDQRLTPFVGVYVLTLAVVSPVLSMRSKALSRLIPSRLLPAPQPELVSS
ncbi:MAG: cation:proton antiporter [Ilumatobacteraceae bacterium]|nr:cation:proton antiporter [Acidimicrobiaceae bacterium]MBP6487503.1 cation:proton antiporter [Ilumatobacteraceae bacterium]MBK9971359.1 cation:proton antiporter [Acidimicrobiaceae bacterium]MBP7887667.1 cation:proton antiporter [Ilumatobacteraceae bacterium]MBP8207939.1 cation:proton antiporter [Ilumatobacteraceae bacterium]